MLRSRKFQTLIKQNILINYQLRALVDLQRYNVASVNRQKRSFQITSIYSTPDKNLPQKDDLNPRSNEYSLSNGDDNAAALEKTAFESSESSPEKERQMAEEESDQDTNPLEFSPANENLNQPKEEEMKTTTESNTEVTDERNRWNEMRNKEGSKKRNVTKSEIQR